MYPQSMFWAKIGKLSFFLSKNFHFYCREKSLYIAWTCFRNVNPMSSFDEAMMGLSPLCFIPKFVESCPPVLEKKIFDGFLPYMGMAAILVM